MGTETNTKLRKQVRQAYWERDQLVALLSKLYPSHLSRHPEADTDWEDDWRNIVCVHIPGGKMLLPTGNDIQRWSQATWHIHDSEVKYFKHLVYKENHWDGHTTDEKYRRLKNLK